MLASIPSATLLGVDGHPVTVEVHVTVGLPGFTIVGLPDTACRESRDRVRAALTTSGIGWPNQKITINLAPSGVRKIGAGLDLAIAVGLLVAAGKVPAAAVEGLGFVGEMGLDGTIRSVPGMLSLVDALDCRGAVVAPRAYHEATLLSRCKVHVASTLSELFDALDRRAAVARAAPGARSAAGRTAPGSGRRARPTRGPLRARGRGRRQPPRAVRRAARRGQDDARPTTTRVASGARRRARARVDPRALGRRCRSRRRARSSSLRSARRITVHRASRSWAAAAMPSGQGR